MEPQKAGHTKRYFTSREALELITASDEGGILSNNLVWIRPTVEMKLILLTRRILPMTLLMRRRKTKPPAPPRHPVPWREAEGEERVSLQKTGAAAVVPLGSQ
ncbi:hypothetical protein ILYODFUR_031011 [Ilyodon furcidens]|uniref:Uncharacterized protein n=1 Tax=Ilyodon furcidens TaxID=33524 RepID=A0ABV0TPW2_9TELE